MAVTTIAEGISALLAANWGLAAPLATADIHFDVGWVDRQWIGQSNASPQVIVSGPMTSPIRYFGMETAVSAAKQHLLSYGIYVINIWLRIMAGTDGDVEEDYAEQMRNEVVRIINEGCITTPTRVTYLIPRDMGRALHELDRTPRLLRFEITVQANYQIG